MAELEIVKNGFYYKFSVPALRLAEQRGSWRAGKLSFLSNVGKRFSKELPKSHC